MVSRTSSKMDSGSCHRSRGSSSRSSGSRKPRRISPPAPPSDSSPNCTNQLDSALTAGQAAVEREFALQKTTKLSRQADLLELNWEEVFVEDLLGVGGFASVCLVSCPKLRRKHGGTAAMSANDGGSSILSFDPSWGPSESNSCMSVDDSDDISDCYALKCLSTRTMSNPRHFVTGAADLVGEAFVLSRLCHPNIIQLHGVTAGNIAEAFIKKGGYFLVLEALDTTLSSQLQQWRKDPVSSMNDFFNRTQSQSAPSIEERLSVAMSIAKGMEYLHSNNVLFRDLKPDNVGFDRNGVVKLFDFGLARETPYECLPGMAGSMLYLSPETILEKFSCKASDVYSFGILTWELVSLLRPYPEFQQPDHLKKAVAVDGHRPDPRVVTHPVKSLIEACWQFNHAARPTFTQVLGYLEGLRDSGKPKRIKSAPTKKSSFSL